MAKIFKQDYKRIKLTEQEAALAPFIEGVTHLFKEDTKDVYNLWFEPDVITAEEVIRRLNKAVEPEPKSAWPAAFIQPGLIRDDEGKHWAYSRYHIALVEAFIEAYEADDPDEYNENGYGVSFNTHRDAWDYLVAESFITRVAPRKIPVDFNIDAVLVPF